MSVNSQHGGDGELLAQVKELVGAEIRLLERHATSDREARLYRRMFELGQRISGSLNLQAILHEIPTFATRELGFRRSALFLDDRNTGFLTCRAMDGYHSDDLRRRLGAVELASNDVLVQRLREQKRVAYAGGASHEPKLAAFADALGVERFVAMPFFGMKKNLLGMLVAGNLRADEESLTTADLASATSGLASLAEQANWAINHCVLYWDLAVERNMLEARIAERTAELKATYSLMKEDLLQAREFQQSILPAAQQLPGVDMEVIYRPLDMVGGDIYDIMAVGEGPIRIFLADATGHGVQASLTTMFIMGEYDRVKHSGLSPAGALRAMNDEIARSYGRLAMHFTALCLDLDRREGTVTYAGAAAPPPYLVRDGELRELEGGGSFVGLMPDVAFPEWRLSLKPGDTICLFTDGLFEPWNEDGHQFGEERLHRALRSAREERRPLGASAYAELERFMGGKALADDVTFLGIRWTDRG
jgi:sigma-B regulation protein RsbU (phosphoserine phosphatase)